MEGIASRAMKCTPNDIPMTSEIKSSHLFPRGVSMASTQRSPSHKSSASIKVAAAYTSVSTALNQKVSEKVKVSAPIKQLPRTAIAVLLVIVCVPSFTTFIRIFVDDQNMNKIAKALVRAESIFTMAATLSGAVANIAIKAPII